MRKKKSKKIAWLSAVWEKVKHYEVAPRKRETLNERGYLAAHGQPMPEHLRQAIGPEERRQARLKWLESLEEKPNECD